MAELRTLLGVLRTDPTPTPPPLRSPGSTGSTDLISGSPPATAVDLLDRGRPRPLPPAVDLSAYRIVQEGLTNVIKHADAARAAVDVRYEHAAT